MKNKLQKHDHSSDTVKCDYCSNFHDFDVPPNLVDEMLDGQVVLFAGAGISTETRNVLPFTFYAVKKPIISISTMIDVVLIAQFLS